MLRAASAVAHFPLFLLLLLILVVQSLIVLCLWLVAGSILVSVLVDLFDDFVGVTVVVVRRDALDHAVEGVVYCSLRGQELVQALIKMLLQLVDLLRLALSFRCLGRDFFVEKDDLALVFVDQEGGEILYLLLLNLAQLSWPFVALPADAVFDLLHGRAGGDGHGAPQRAQFMMSRTPDTVLQLVAEDLVDFLDTLLDVQAAHHLLTLQLL